MLYGHLSQMSTYGKSMEAKIRLIVTFTWTERSQFSEASASLLTIPSKEKLQKGRASHLWRLHGQDFCSLEDQAPECHMPRRLTLLTLPVCLPRRLRVQELGKAIGLRWSPHSAEGTASASLLLSSPLSSATHLLMPSKRATSFPRDKQGCLRDGDAL